MIKSLAAGLLSASLGLNNPSGHQLIHDISLRIAFSDALDFSRSMEEQPHMSFEEFRAFAPFFFNIYYEGDQDKISEALRLFSISLCLPQGDDNNPQENFVMACHLSTRKEETETLTIGI